MSQPLLNLSANQRLDLSDMRFLAQDQPLGLASDAMGAFATRAQSTAQMYVLHGFRVNVGVSTNALRPAQNQAAVTPGAGILSYRQGAATPLYGVLAALSGVDQTQQGVDFSDFPSGSYTIFLRLNYSASEVSDRTFWNAADPGFEYAQSIGTRLTATFEVQALVSSASPGPEWLRIANVVWAAPTTQGGAGALSNLTDVRPLFFEGVSNATPPYASTWGSVSDRSSDRSSLGVGDLHRFCEAMRTCIEDVKGPGLRRWWEAGIGGMNVGFAPSAPMASRLAVGDSGFYLQGRTPQSPADAFQVFKPGTLPGSFLGWHIGPNLTRLMFPDNSPALTVYPLQQAIGIGPRADSELVSGQGRALFEVVNSTNTRVAMRLGARSLNDAQPSGLDVLMSVIAPDSQNTLAAIQFGTGGLGMPTPEQILYRIGKNPSNEFTILDAVNGQDVLSHNYLSKRLVLSCASLQLRDLSVNTDFFDYMSATQTVRVFRRLELSGALSVMGGSTFNDSIMVNGSATVSAATVVGRNNLVSGGNLSVSLQGTFGGIVQTPNLVATVTNVSSQYRINNFIVILPDRIVLPSGTVDPNPAAPGTMYFNTNNNRVRIYNGAADGWQQL